MDSVSQLTLERLEPTEQALSILNDHRSDHQTEADLARQWEPEDDDREWEPDGLDDSSSWLPTDSWFDRQAEIYEAKGSDVANFAAAWFRETAKAMRVLDASTLDEYIARAENYPN